MLGPRRRDFFEDVMGMLEYDEGMALTWLGTEGYRSWSRLQVRTALHTPGASFTLLSS